MKKKQNLFLVLVSALMPLSVVPFSYYIYNCRIIQNETYRPYCFEWHVEVVCILMGLLLFGYVLILKYLNLKTAMIITLIHFLILLLCSSNMVYVIIALPEALKVLISGETYVVARIWCGISLGSWIILLNRYRKLKR